MLRGDGNRPGLRVVGTIATVAGDEGHIPVHFGGSATIEQWIVIGQAGVLPSNVPLTADWATLLRAYGPLASQSGSNGDVFLRFCRLPDFAFSMTVPFAALVDTVHLAAAESTRLASPIAQTYVPRSVYAGTRPTSCP